MLNELARYKKVDSTMLSPEEFKMKDYFKELLLDAARMKFQERSATMNYCHSHYNNPEKIFGRTIDASIAQI